MGEPSTVATGAGAALSATAGAAACCWPFPHAAIKTTMAVTMDARAHGVLKNWVICFLYAKKKRLRPKAYAPGGGSLALNVGISPIFCLRGGVRRSTAATHQNVACSLERRQRFDGERMNVGLHQI